MRFWSGCWRLGLCAGAFVGCSNGTDPPQVQPASLVFRAPIDLSLEAAPQGHVMVGDANADGWFDILTWGDETQQLNLADPVQRGILRAQEVTGLPAVNVKQVYWLDLDGDKAADLLVLDADGKIRRFDNRFGKDDNPAKYKEVEFTSGNPTSESFTLLDIDRDGVLDVISASRGGDGALRVEILLGTGSNFALAKRVVLPAKPPAEGAAPAVLYPSDVNNDGVWDLVIGADGLGLGVLYDGRGYTDLVTQVDAGTMPADAVTTTAPQAFDASSPDLVADAGGSDAGSSAASRADAGDNPSDGDSAAPPNASDNDEFNSEDLRWEAVGSNTDFEGSFVLADANADNTLDLFRFSSSSKPVVLVGQGDGSFTSTALGSVNKAALGCVEDFNNDTYLDVLTAGEALALSMAKGKVGEFESAVTINDAANVRGVACIDLDGDGDVDVVTSGKEGTKLYINALEPLGHDEAHFYGFRFRGKDGNLAALGTRVRVTLGKKTQVREFVFPGRGASALVPALHMGLGTHGAIDEVNITWPNGAERTDEDWEAGAVGTVLVP